MQVCHQPPTLGISHNSCSMRAFACGLKYNVWRTSTCVRMSRVGPMKIRYFFVSVRLSRTVETWMRQFNTFTCVRVSDSQIDRNKGISHSNLGVCTCVDEVGTQIRRCASRHCSRRCWYARCTRENAVKIAHTEIIITITAFAGDN